MAQSNSALPAATAGLVAQQVQADENGPITDVDDALDDILGSSEMLGLSTQDERDDDADDADLEDDLEEDESGDEEDEADGIEATDDDDDAEDEEDSTEGEDEEDGDDDGELDWEYKVPVKIDGEESEVDLKELVKGYQTSQHLSKKGRELADERKQFEESRTAEMKKITDTAAVLQAQSQIVENEMAEKYKELQESAKAAKKSGDDYEASKIKDEMEEVQHEYWKARKTREKVAEAVQKQAEADAEKQFAAQVEKFNEEIGDYVPDFNEEKATALREFAISKGIPEETLQYLADARIIGALNEFMELSQKVTKGSAKRKKTPTRKATPTKKTTPTSVKKKQASQARTKRIQAGEGSIEDLESSLDDMIGNYFG